MPHVGNVHILCKDHICEVIKKNFGLLAVPEILHDRCYLKIHATADTLYKVNMFICGYNEAFEKWKN